MAAAIAVDKLVYAVNGSAIPTLVDKKLRAVEAAM